MRLACLSTDPGVAYGGTKGASVHLAAIAEAVAASGSEVLVLAASVDPDSTTPAGVTVEALPGPGKGAATAERLRFEPELAAWLTGRLDDFRAGALYERLALHSAAGNAAARRLGIPHLLELNAPLRVEAARYRSLEEPGRAEQLEGETLRGADIVFAVSPPLADYARAEGAIRVEVLQNAAHLERFPPPARSGDRPLAVFAGSLRPWHGIDTIAGAWRLLGSAAPRLLVLGDGPARGLLDGIPATVVGTVAPPRVPDLLAGADIGLAPYSADAPQYFSPLKLFEYLAAGLATVVADLPAVVDVVTAETAVVIPRGDAGALAEAVAALCADPARRAMLGANGRALVEARHTWAHRARRIVAAADELAGSGVGA
jgi:glycosyltransferase involved in cell wall biosynthesis